MDEPDTVGSVSYGWELEAKTADYSALKESQEPVDCIIIDLQHPRGLRGMEELAD